MNAMTFTFKLLSHKADFKTHTAQAYVSVSASWQSTGSPPHPTAEMRSPPCSGWKEVRTVSLLLVCEECSCQKAQNETHWTHTGQPWARLHAAAHPQAKHRHSQPTVVSHRHIYARSINKKTLLFQIIIMKAVCIMQLCGERTHPSQVRCSLLNCFKT